MRQIELSRQNKSLEKVEKDCHNFASTTAYVLLLD